AVIAENQTTTVTITNTFNTNGGGDPDPEDGTLIVNKILAGNNKPAGDTEFTITINGEEHLITAGANSFDLAPGTYTIIETRDRGASSVSNSTQTAVIEKGITTNVNITNIFNRSSGGGNYTPPEKPDEPNIIAPQPPVAIPPVTDLPVESAAGETIAINEPPTAQPLPRTGGPVLLFMGGGLGLICLGILTRRLGK
ncbi:MAG: hypothetical protein GX808_12460, partial [Syntrophomonadaceae bacterium]|nr:hypothetical protein [Syntrophomonadaceae bacterium]